MDAGKKLSLRTPSVEGLVEALGMNNNEGWTDEISNDVYHAGPGISATGLKEVLRSPKKFKWKRDNPEPPCDAFKIGNALHCMVLEPGKYDGLFATWTGDDRRTKEGKERWRSFCIQNSGRTVLELDQFDCVKGMAKSLRTHAKFSKMLEEGVKELSFYSEAHSGVLCRARPDLYIPDKGLIVDVKTNGFDITEDGEDFAREVINRGYHVQAAFHLAVVKNLGFKAVEFCFAAVEKSPPYDCAVYYLDKQMRDIGEELFQRALSLYGQCAAANEWPGVPQKVLPLSFPKWYLQRFEKEQ